MGPVFRTSKVIYCINTNLWYRRTFILSTIACLLIVHSINWSSWLRQRCQNLISNWAIVHPWSQIVVHNFHCAMYLINLLGQYLPTSMVAYSSLLCWQRFTTFYWYPMLIFLISDYKISKVLGRVYYKVWKQLVTLESLYLG